VFFRQSTREEARRLGLAGWVRNLPDGSVEVLACGEPDAVEALIRFLHSGPPLAEVHGVRIRDEADCAPPPSFEIRYDVS